MERIYSIYIHPSSLVSDEWMEACKVKIRKLGLFRSLGNEFYIIKTKRSVAEIYNEITSGNFDMYETLVLISEIIPSTDSTYGIASPDLWKFLGMYTEQKKEDGSN